MILDLCVYPILCTINGVNRKYNKNYCFPSQNKILWLMKNFYGVTRSRATLNRWLRVLEDEGYIKRVRRHRKDPLRGYIFKSSLYTITLKGYKKLWSLGINVFKQIKEIQEKMFRSKKKSAADEADLRGIKKGLGKDTMIAMERSTPIRSE